MGTAFSDLERNCASKCCGSDSNNDNNITQEISSSSPQQQTPTTASNQNKEQAEAKSELSTLYNNIESNPTATESNNIENSNTIIAENDTAKTSSYQPNTNYNATKLEEESNTVSYSSYSASENVSASNINTLNNNEKVQIESKTQYDKDIVNESVNMEVTTESEIILESKQKETVNDTKTVNSIKKMKLMFLDIDGVLNDKKCRPRTVKPELLMKLKKIIISTDCKIVLSSSWRRVDELKNKFKKEFNKVTEMDIENILFGQTPCNGRNPTRVHEIMQYFERNEDKENFKQEEVNWVVVDDMDLLNENSAFKKELKRFVDGHWIQTNIETGLTDQNVEHIISILNVE